MGGHDLYACLIEIILDILMKGGIDGRHIVRLLDISVDLVDRVEVAQGRFENEGSRFGHHAGCCLGGIYQKLMHLAPGGIVADRYLRVDDQPVSACRRSIVDCL